MYTAEYFSDVIDQAIPVKLAAPSFILSVPPHIGERLVYPSDIEGDPPIRKGMDILDREGKPKGTGLVFWNYVDKAFQAVRDDGHGVIIFGDMSIEQAKELRSHFQKITGNHEATAENIRQMLCDAHEKFGINDFYNSTHEDMSAAETVEGDATSRVAIRHSKEQRYALLGLGSGIYAGPASSPQRFEHNVVVLLNEKKRWMVQTPTFLRTYKHPDGHTITTHELPTFKMREGRPPQLALAPV